MDKPTRVLLLDESRGIYIPAVFAYEFDFKEWGLEPKTEFDTPLTTIAADLSDPENANYWDAWDYVTENAVYISDGRDGLLAGRWTLDQDGDLFAVHESHVADD